MKAKYITSPKWQKLTLKGVICTHFYLMETERHKQKLTKTAEVKYQEKLWNCLTSTGKHGGGDSALKNQQTLQNKLTVITYSVTKSLSWAVTDCTDELC